MKFQITGIIILYAIRFLYNAEAEDFNEAFGQSGPHLWNKFLGYGQKEGDFIGALDYTNLAKLSKAAIKMAVEEKQLLEKDWFPNEDDKKS